MKPNDAELIQRILADDQGKLQWRKITSNLYKCRGRPCAYPVPLRPGYRRWGCGACALLNRGFTRITRNDADFFRLNRGFTRITQNDADFGHPRGMTFSCRGRPCAYPLALSGRYVYRNASGPRC